MRPAKKVSLALTGILAISGAAFGSGFSIFEQGAKATGMAGAFAATADDPSAIFYNVAGIAQQREMAVMAGGTTINFANQFRGDPNDAFTSGVSASYARHTFIPPNSYAVMPIGQSLTLGVGLFSAYGLRTDWEDPYPGRFVSKDANLKTVSVEPAIAWQNATGRIAVGAGIEYRRGHVILERGRAELNPFTQRFTDVANIRLNSDWDSDWGWNVGFLFKPTDIWRVGVAYRSAMTIDFKGDATFTPIPSGFPQFDAAVRAKLPPDQAIATSIPFPATTSIGIATSMIPKWDVELDVTHVTWSRFESLDVSFAQTPAVNLSRAQNWEDTNSYRLGTNGKVSDNWDVRFGVVYDENPEPAAAVSPILPDSDRMGVSFGVGFHHGPWFVDVSDFVLHFKERSTEGQSPDFNGTYKTDGNLVGVNVGYRF